MTRRLALSLTALMAMTQTAAGLTLTLPGNASQTASVSEPMSSFALTIGAYDADGVAKLQTEGAVSHQAWRIRGSGRATTLQMLAPLREQLKQDGFNILFECADEACGGFDFRYETHVLPEPDMHVDLGDFHYLAAARVGEGDREYAALIISRSAESGFIQLTRVGPGEALPPTVTTSTKAPALDPVGSYTGSLGEVLEKMGSAPLDDLSFGRGSSDLTDEDFPSLTELAEYLTENPDRSVKLVGHTDAEGQLAGNIILSKRRAESVMQRLVTEFGIPASQISAEGVGYLAPRATNLDEEGRTLNRRVEVILADIE